MFFLWGSYAIPRTATGPVARCPDCGKDALDRRMIERVGHVFFAPIVPMRFRATTRCTACGRETQVRVRRFEAPRRVAAPRLAIAWTAIGLMFVLGVVGEIVVHRLARDRARAPQIGDRWTVDTHAWRTVEPAVADEFRYARLRIDAVHGAGVTASACAYASDDQSAIEQKCRDFRIGGEVLDGDAVGRMIDAGAVVSVWRDGRDPGAAFFGGIGLLAFALIGFGFHTRRWVRRRPFEGPPVPEARVVIP